MMGWMAPLRHLSAKLLSDRNSSEREPSMGGISTPYAFAVARLMTRSNLVGCWTGKSPGLAPLKILSMNNPCRRNTS